MMCFHKSPVVWRYALVMWMLNSYFSHFFTSFFIGLCRICLHAKVRNVVFINCSLLVGIDCLTDKLKAALSCMKNMLFCPQIHSLECSKWHFRALKFQNFLGLNMPRSPPNPLPPPLEKRGPTAPYTDLIQLVTLFKPAGECNFYWNPCIMRETMHCYPRMLTDDSCYSKV